MICNIYMNFVSTVTLPVCKIPNQIVLIRLTPHRNSDRFHSCRNFNIFHNNIKSSLICIIILNLHICTWSNHLKRCFPKEYQRSTCQICIGMYLINSSNLLIRNTHIRFPDSVRFLLSCNPANITLICLVPYRKLYDIHVIRHICKLQLNPIQITSVVNRRNL